MKQLNGKSRTEANAGAAPAAPNWGPELEAADIQGNILTGFNKNYQWFLGLSLTGECTPGDIGDKVVRVTREWLGWLTPQIATMDRVAEHNRWFRQRRRKTGREPYSTQVWTHIAFTYEGIHKLIGPDAQEFTHPPFRLGMAERSSFLGDPTDPAAAGHPWHWTVGGVMTPIDMLLIIASDSQRAAKRQVKLIEQSLLRMTGFAIHVEYKELGKVRTDQVDGLDMHGHEQFGFKDGLSQPAVRGWIRLPSGDLVPVTRREYAEGDPTGEMYAAPGQPLIQPGQFVFGYPKQHERRAAGERLVSLPAQGVPMWAKNGSFLAFRRLRQDVPLFRETVAAKAHELGVDPDWLGSRMVGRWKSGAPIMRSQWSDSRDLAADHLAANNFQFANPGMADLTASHHPRSQADPVGLACPMAAHIRKVNPRDEGTDVGSLSDTLTRRIIRRGINYGDPLPQGERDNRDRGLLFVSYQTSLEDQFEFLQNDWMNRTAVPSQGGHDPLLGQNALTASRERSFHLTPAVEVKGLPDFVIPTGGAYLFSPSIAALRDVLGK